MFYSSKQKRTDYESSIIEKVNVPNKHLLFLKLTYFSLFLTPVKICQKKLLNWLKFCNLSLTKNYIAVDPSDM